MKKLSFLSFFILLSQINFTEDKPMEIKLKDTVITESNFENSVTSTPKNLTIITSEEFQERGAKTVADAIKTAPGIITKTLTGAEPIFDLRGQGESARSNVVVLLDGIPLNSLDSSGYNTSNIPLEQINRIEIVPGGGAVLYGDGAVAGTINIISKNPSEKSNLGSVGVEAGSYDLFKYSVNYGTKLSNKLFFDLDYSKKNQNGYRDYSRTDLSNFSGKLKYLLNEGSIDFKYGYSENNFKAPGSLTVEEVHGDRKQSNIYYGINGTTETSLYNLKYSQKLNNKLEFVTYFDYTDQKYESYNRSDSTNGFDYDTNKFYIKPQLKYNYSDINYFIIGGDYLNAKTDVTKGWTLGERTKDSEGIFAINRFQTGKFQFTQGYRYQTIDIGFLDNGFHKNKTLNEDSIELSANYLYSDSGSIYLNFTDSFRTPNTDELAYWSGDVKSQDSKTLELGTKNMIGNTYYSASLFLTNNNNEIIFAQDEFNTTRNFNLDGKTERIGSEIFLEHYLSDLTLRESFTIMKSKIKDGMYSGSEIPGVPNFKFVLGATYALTPKLKLNSDLTYTNGAYDTTDFYNIYGKVNSFVTLDLSVNYDINSSTKIYAGINNLFDREYYNYVGGTDWPAPGTRFYYPADGRNYYVGIKKTF